MKQRNRPVDPEGQAAIQAALDELVRLGIAWKGADGHD